MKRVGIVHLRASGSDAPFEQESLNDAYAHWCTVCREAGFELLIAGKGDIEGKTLTNAWSFAKRWTRLPSAQVHVLMAKLRHGSEADAIIARAEAAGAVLTNDPKLNALFNDKHASYERYAEQIPISLLARDREEAEHRIGELRAMDLHPDLDPEIIFVKPRYGSEGRGIRIVTGNDFSMLGGEGAWIVQPRIRASMRFRSFMLDTAYDIRIVMANDEICKAYLRIAREGLISNAARGGNILYIPLEQIPCDTQGLCHGIDATLTGFGERVYSIDFVIGESGKPWVIEMNGQPAVSFNEHNDQDIREKKRFHRVYARIFERLLDR